MKHMQELVAELYLYSDPQANRKGGEEEEEVE